MSKPCMCEAVHRLVHERLSRIKSGAVWPAAISGKAALAMLYKWNADELNKAASRLRREVIADARQAGILPPVPNRRVKGSRR